MTEVVDATASPGRVAPRVGPAFVEAVGLQKTYAVRRGEPVKAFEDLSFTIREGEFIACVGPSGCGKSTLLKILAGLIGKTGGELRILGEPVTGPRRDVGVVFQSPVLLPWMTVLQNTMLPGKVIGLDKAKTEERARHLIAMAGLEGFEDKYPYELSGGMQQRNAIIRALIHDPSILLMDEPFGALDAMTREFMNVELQRIWLESRKTVFFITHSIPEAVFLADRVMVLSNCPGQLLDLVDIDLPRPRRLEDATEAHSARSSSGSAVGSTPAGRWTRDTR